MQMNNSSNSCLLLVLTRAGCCSEQDVEHFRETPQQSYEVAFFLFTIFLSVKAHSIYWAPTTFQAPG